jgi:A/G-specific adenine glycosylase
VHADLSGALLAWGEANRRDLPWRRTRDPWAVLVSELMLQQTQVPRVVRRWGEFLDRFPTVASCAEAPVADVVRAWVGLGYNRRAVNLHRCATAVVERHGGVMPDELAPLLALPGIGPYTARAVLVFAFERDIGLVDTNAGRFVARALAGRRVGPKEAQALADAAVPAGCGWAWGQAVFDLGARVCTKRDPDCMACPLLDLCEWANVGWLPPDPVEGSAGISKPQPPLAGSDREGRARLVIDMCFGPLSPEQLPASAGWPDDPERTARVVASLVADGLAVATPDGGLRLP